MTSQQILGFDHNDFLTPPGVSVPDAARSYLEDLAKTARQHAEEQTCSSLLVGQSNETDETEDVGVWLGPGDFRNAENVLAALGLEEWGNTIEHAQSEVQSAEVNDKLHMLDERHGFRVRRGAYVAVFIIGRMAAGWGGLVGVGVWT